ncbi:MULTISPECIES: metallophosphoesterase family protein [unclassified Thermotoga]|uniref:metallophosphoesterase family protein n=1 Tax=unclassified Thermotoga TaxID=2631113 RepID=UPI000280EA52|nr:MULTISPECIES: metallophosphoesterase [unclassified Thermotoga]AIY87245.1 phosphodiesterase [Thermotoga sp. 2812B]EJX25332.1 phosphodiesterase [Thermotoga sp. EMP]KAF2960088.1 metallophosphatase [Thermotoga sp. 38H-to]
MKRFLLISDSHVPVRMASLPDEILNSLKEYDGVIGLGDYVDLDTVILLEKFSKEFYGVYGNMDYPDVKEHLPFSKVLLVEGVTIGMCHGWGAPWDLKDRLLKVFNEKPQVILFGHTHEPEDTVKSGVRFLNPGSLAEGSYAVLELDGGEVRFELKTL